ncbi:MAG: hypothetical protein KDA96_03285 [Planctomycetaceae bacterium]|nr:hypothetical protein [Planctomycetaceae bacterium]
MKNDTLKPADTRWRGPLCCLTGTLLAFTSTVLLTSAQNTVADETSAPASSQNAATAQPPKPSTPPEAQTGQAETEAPSAPEAEAGAGSNTQPKSRSSSTSSYAEIPEYPEDHRVAHRSILVPITQQPYIVTIDVAFRGTMARTSGQREQLQREIATAVRRMYGQLWDFRVRASEWLIPGSIPRLVRLEEDDVTEHYPHTMFDKTMLVCLEENAGIWQVAVREYDPRIQELTPTLQAQTMDARNLGTIAAQLMRDVFRPVLFLTAPVRGGSDEMTFDLQGGLIPPPDPSAVQMSETDVLRPFVRRLDRRDRNHVLDIQRLPLEYIRVTRINKPLTVDLDPEGELTAVSASESEAGAVPMESEPWADTAHVDGVLISHRPISTFGRRTSNAEQFAVRQRPSARSSKVRLVMQNRDDRPLICHRIDRVTKLRVKDEDLAPAVRLISDRNGELEMEIDPDHATFWLYVYSGSTLLARVPYAPGLVPEDTLELPDDSIRLGVEGELYLFRDDLVDGVAQRAVLMSMAKRESEADQMQEFELLIEQIDELPGKDEFHKRLDDIRNQAVRRATDTRNRSAERRINKLCDAMKKSLDEFFTSENQTREREELIRLRQRINPNRVPPSQPGTPQPGATQPATPQPGATQPTTPPATNNPFNTSS